VTAPVLFLLGAVTLSILGAMVVWLLSRPRKERFGESIHSFRQDLSALAPPPPAPPRSRPGPRPSETGKR
jgi:hypothetical protein